MPPKTIKSEQYIAILSQSKKLANESQTLSPSLSKKYDKDASLKAYAKENKKIIADRLIIEFLPMVQKIVHQVTSYLHPPLTREDLVSAGTIGLIRAARDFDPSHDAEFKTYAYIRIRGAVIDEFRALSFTPSSVKKQLKQDQKVINEMAEEDGQLLSDEQLAQKLGISVNEMYKVFVRARARHFLSIHGLNDDTPALGHSLVAENTERPFDRMEKAELVEKLARSIGKLKDNHRKVILLYYQKELTMKEIALVLKVTESRVSQLHAAALVELSLKLKQ